MDALFFILEGAEPVYVSKELNWTAGYAAHTPVVLNEKLYYIEGIRLVARKTVFVCVNPATAERKDLDLIRKLDRDNL